MATIASEKTMSMESFSAIVIPFLFSENENSPVLRYAEDGTITRGTTSIRPSLAGWTSRTRGKSRNVHAL